MDTGSNREVRGVRIGDRGRRALRQRQALPRRVLQMWGNRRVTGHEIAKTSPSSFPPLNAPLFAQDCNVTHNFDGHADHHSFSIDSVLFRNCCTKQSDLISVDIASDKTNPDVNNNSESTDESCNTNNVADMSVTFFIKLENSPVCFCMDCTRFFGDDWYHLIKFAT